MKNIFKLAQLGMDEGFLVLINRNCQLQFNNGGRNAVVVREANTPSGLRYIVSYKDMITGVTTLCYDDNGNNVFKGYKSVANHLTMVFNKINQSKTIYEE